MTGYQPVFVGVADEITGGSFDALDRVGRFVFGPPPKLAGDGKLLLSQAATAEAASPPSDRLSRGWLELIAYQSIADPEGFIPHPEVKVGANPRDAKPGGPEAYADAADKGGAVPTPAQQQSPKPHPVAYWAARGKKPDIGVP
ncbi:hypothetical protein [Limnoglobus roseus]|uniref:Uncharacterized protein n=1 Tax=Limnoglobus roseus TaxID=2598579 RepID=A0A5C1AEB5_9BACT|nr:hypothetical protein [Limnoglobus roseus]QEL16915.1 hypothetical protein PX52LOC_03891 [Limnoglobus roseus]